MQRLNKSITHAVDRPVKVMQFGEGNFLRAFVDYIFDVTNEKTDFNGGVVIVKALSNSVHWKDSMIRNASTHFS